MISPSQEIRPRRLWYAVAAIILACGATAFAILLVSFITGVTGAAGSMTRVVVPTTADIKFDKPGGYTIFHEYQSIVAGRVYNDPTGIGGLTCTLTDKTTSGNITLRPASGGAYSMGSYAGRSLFDFTIRSPGVYTLNAQYAGGAGGPEAVLSIGHNFVGGLFLSIAKMLAAVGILVVSILLSILIFVVTIVRRSAAKKRSNTIGDVVTQPPLSH